MNWTERPLKVKDLITELLTLDQELELVIPDAPYGQPNYLRYVGVVILKEDDGDTGVKAGEYIGLGIGNDFDEPYEEDAEEDAEEEKQESPLIEPELQKPKVEKNFSSFKEFEEDLFKSILEDE